MREVNGAMIVTRELDTVVHIDIDGLRGVGNQLYMPKWRAILTAALWPTCSHRIPILWSSSLRQLKS